MAGFLSGYKFIAVPHVDGSFDKEMVIEIYTTIIECIDIRQDEKIERDYRRLYCLEDGKYFVVLRERVGVQSENERVRLGEFKIPGRLIPAFTSEFTVWDKSIAKSLIKDLRELTEGGEIEEVLKAPV